MDEYGLFFDDKDIFYCDFRYCVNVTFVCFKSAADCFFFFFLLCKFATE